MDLNGDTGGCSLNGAHPPYVRKDKAGKKLKACGYIIWLPEQNSDEGQQHVQYKKIKTRKKIHWIWENKVIQSDQKAWEFTDIKENCAWKIFVTCSNIVNKMNCNKNILIGLNQMQTLRMIQ